MGQDRKFKENWIKLLDQSMMIDIWKPKEKHMVIKFTNFEGLHVPKDGLECKSFTVISVDSLLASKFRHLCLKSCKQPNDRLSL